VIRLLKQDNQTKTIPIIVVTASAMPGDEKKGSESGCDAYITKPITIGKLLRLSNGFKSVWTLSL
jgi:two-component system cell cycle response regulator DivK